MASARPNKATIAAAIGSLAIVDDDVLPVSGAITQKCWHLPVLAANLAMLFAAAKQYPRRYLTLTRNGTIVFGSDGGPGP